MELPVPEIVDCGAIRALHLGTEWVQGSMLVGAPDVLLHEYTQQMMAGLLFVDAATVHEGRAMQLGLGAGTLRTRFCLNVVPMRTVAVECNPAVVALARRAFAIPMEHPALEIVIADAGAEVRRARWRAAIDLLHVDLYDDEAAAPVLDTPAFYADCASVLTPRGVMTVNVFGRDADPERSRRAVAEGFGVDPAAVRVLSSPTGGNSVLVAERVPSSPGAGLLTERATLVAELWGLPAGDWIPTLAAP